MLTTNSLSISVRDADDYLGWNPAAGCWIIN